MSYFHISREESSKYISGYCFNKLKIKQEDGDHLGVCVLNLQIVSEKLKSLTRPRDKRNT